MAAANAVKMEGKENDLLKRILEDEAFGLTEDELNALTDVRKFTGRAKEQTEEFLSDVAQILEQNRELLGVEVSIKV
jgi:Adenylosuccinate lyase C-terminus.